MITRHGGDALAAGGLLVAFVVGCAGCVEAKELGASSMDGADTDDVAEEPVSSGSDAGGDRGHSTDASQDETDGERIESVLGSYPPWEDPPETSKVPTGEKMLSDVVFRDHVGYQCEYQTYDVTQNYDRALALASTHAAVMPGMMLSGHGVLQGVFNVLPVKRGPITLSIDVPVPNPIRVVESPSSATIQAAILSLMREADDADTLRRDFVHTTRVVSSFEDASMFFNVDIDYSGPLVEAGLTTTFESERSLFTHYFALKHVEELFTISFSDDLIFTEADFFAEDVDEEDIRSLETRSLVGPGNPPVYVRSVTYGRLALATAKVTEQHETSEFETLVEANGFGVDASVELRDEYSKLASTLDFDVLVRGGTRDEALAALQGAKITDMFGAARAVAAAPLYYRINFAAGDRRVARTSDTTRYTEQTCFAVGAEPCEWACPPGWTKVSDSRCDGPGAGSATWAFEATGKENTRTSGTPVNLPEPSAAESARVCFYARRLDGGMHNDSQPGILVECDSHSRIVSLAELWSGVGWCWEAVPASAICDVTAPYAEWTPNLQCCGTADVSMNVDRYIGKPRCYKDQW